MTMALTVVAMSISIACLLYFSYSNEVQTLYEDLGRATERSAHAYEKSPTLQDERLGGATIIGDDSNGPTPIASYILSETGQLICMATKSTATLSDETLSAALFKLTSADEDQGHLDNLSLYYCLKSYDGFIVVSFADESSVSHWKSQAVYMAILGVGVVLIFLVLTMVFSRKLIEPAQRVWDSQQQFIADASHELKTPLTVIMANNEVLLSKQNETIAQERQWIESTQTEAESMQSLIKDLLMLAKSDIEAKQKPTETVNFSNLVERNALQFESVAFERNLTFETTIQPDCKVLGWEDKLNRLVAILLDNACKYGKPGTVVNIGLIQGAGTGKNSGPLLFNVNNQGDAIPAEELPLIFDRFYRADKVRTHGTGAESYGLGLSIAKSIVENHGGSISATSSEAAGTTFSVTMPQA